VVSDCESEANGLIEKIEKKDWLLGLDSNQEPFG